MSTSYEDYNSRDYRSNDEPMPKNLGVLALGSLVLLGACKLYDTVKEAITGKKNK